MNTETKISVSRSLINDYEIELKEIDESISKLERDKRQATTMSTMGIAQMGSSTLRPIGTYNYVSNSNKLSTINSKISRLKMDKLSVEQNLREEKRNLRELEEEYEFERRPEAKLVVENDKIYIEGDENKTNVIGYISQKILSYFSEYERLINSKNVHKYLSLKESLESVAKSLDLPKAEHKLLHRMECYKSNYDLDFDYIVIDGKVLVDRDFVTPKIADYESYKNLYEEFIERNKKQYDMFEPNVFGKVFKFVREKQKTEWDKGVLAKENEYKERIKTYDKEIESLDKIKNELILPAEPALDTIRELTDLVKESYDVRTYISKADEYKKNIDNSTIFKSQGQKNISQLIFRAIKDYLDKNNLKLTPSNVYNVIYSNPQFEYLAKEIKNAIGYEPPKHIASKQTTEQKTIKSESTSGGPSLE